jgi:TP901 family phage tail tape measure protein
MSSRFEVGVLVSLVDRLTRPLKAMGDGFKRLGHDLSAAKSKFSKMNNAMKNAGQVSGKIGSSLSRKLTLPILGLGVAAIKTSMNFNKGMANVGSLIPGNQKRVKELGDAMLKLSTDTGSSTSDLTDGLYQVVSAFGDTAETADRMKIVVKASTAGLSTATDAVNLLSAVTKGYGDTSAAAMKKASDLAFVTVRLGQTTFPELASSMGKVIPLAQAMGVSQEELFATFSTLTGVTGSAAEVSTQMRGAIQALMAPTTDMKKALTAAGFASGQAMIKQLGLVGALDKMMKSTGGNTEMMKKLFPTIESMPAIMQLTGKGAGKFSDALNQMRTAAGATDQAFKDQTEGVNKAGFSWKKLMASLKVMAIQIGQTVLPVVSQFASMFAAIFGVIAKLPGPVKTVVVAFLGLLAAVGPVMKLYSAFQKLKAGMALMKATKIGKTFTTMLGPLKAVLGKFMIFAAVVGGIIAIFSKGNIQIQKNIDLSKELAKETTDISKAYDMAAKSAGKLTAEQRAQMQLRALEANKKLLENMESSYNKLTELAAQVNRADEGSRERQEAMIKLKALAYAYERDITNFKKTQKMLGRSDAETQAQLGGLGTGANRAMMGGQEGMQKLLNFYTDKKGPAMGNLANSIAGALVQNPVNLAGKINIHVKADGNVSSTATFPGSKVGAAISAQSVKNGRMR